MATLIFRWGLVVSVFHLEAIRFKEAETKDWKENFITVFFKINCDFTIELIVCESNYRVLLKMIPLPLHKFLNYVKIELLEKPVNNFTFNHQLKVKKSGDFIASLLTSFDECTHIVVGTEILTIVLWPCYVTVFIYIENNLFRILLQMKHLSDKTWRVLLLQTKKCFSFFSSCMF